MNTWQRGLVLSTVASFPLAVYFFTAAKSTPLSILKSTPTVMSTQAATTDLHKGVELKVHEIKDLDVKILQNRGEILRLEENKLAVIKELEDLQTKLASTLQEMKATIKQ